jgi:hypothetical protein
MAAYRRSVEDEHPIHGGKLPRLNPWSNGRSRASLG